MDDFRPPKQNCERNSARIPKIFGLNIILRTCWDYHKSTSQPKGCFASFFPSDPISRKHMPPWERNCLHRTDLVMLWKSYLSRTNFLHRKRNCITNWASFTES